MKHSVKECRNVARSVQDTNDLNALRHRAIKNDVLAHGITMSAENYPK